MASHRLVVVVVCLVFGTCITTSSAGSGGVVLHGKEGGDPLFTRKRSDAILSLPITVFGHGTGNASIIETTFELYQGDPVEDAMDALRLKYSLEDPHMRELREAVRDGLLIHGTRAVPISTLILFGYPHQMAFPFMDQEYLKSDVEIIVVGHSSDETMPFAEGGSYTTIPYLVNLTQHFDKKDELASKPSMVYALVSPLTRFKKGHTVESLFLEYERFRYASTGSFQASLVLGMSCGNDAHLDVILWDDAAMRRFHASDTSLIKNADFLQALLRPDDGSKTTKMQWSTSVYNTPSIFTRKWLECEGMGRLPSLGGINAMKASSLDILIVIIAQGQEDKVTSGVFMDVAHVLEEAFHELGLKASIGVCDFLDRCALPKIGPTWVILAPHNLASYVDPNDRPAVLSRDDLIPSSSILYNFEHIHVTRKEEGEDAAVEPKKGTTSLAKGEVFDIYRKYVVWDFSWSNVIRLQQYYNVSATYVPVGYSPCLELSRRWEGEDQKGQEDAQIAVLFFGTVLPRRLEIIQSLRNAGIPVLYPSLSSNGTYGPELDEHIMNAKIILSLLAFDDDTEWKMTRFLKPLANKRLIISERSGDSSSPEQDYYSKGIVFVEKSNIIEVCRYYLDHPLERAIIANEGYKLFRAMREHDILKGQMKGMADMGSNPSSSAVG